MRVSIATTQSSPMRLTLLGQGHLADGKPIGIHIDPTSNAEAVIAIDTTQATAADLEQAFVAAQGLIQQSISRGRQRVFGTVTGPPSAEMRDAAAADGRASGYLHVLADESEATVRSFGRGRALDISIPRPKVRIQTP